MSKIGKPLTEDILKLVLSKILVSITGESFESALLKETGGYLLLESGDKILLEG